MNFIQKFYYKFKYKQGALISQFVAHDIKLEIIVVDNSKIDHGLLLVQERFIDCISFARDNNYNLPEFSEPKLVEIARLWKWDVKVIREFGK